MIKRWIIPVVVLPGTSLVFVPLAVLWLSRNSDFAGSLASLRSLQFWLSILIAIPGTLLSFGSAALFFRHGNGTAAPWDPPRKLVVRGPYCHVRNPMLSGVIALLFAESLILQSWPLAGWASVFAVSNMVYFPLVEEPGLRARFGDEYRVYCQHVPRWVPRIRSWKPAKDLG